jgi:hypothetical protein
LDIKTLRTGDSPISEHNPAIVGDVREDKSGK